MLTTICIRIIYVIIRIMISYSRYPYDDDDHAYRTNFDAQNRLYIVLGAVFALDKLV